MPDAEVSDNLTAVLFIARDLRRYVSRDSNPTSRLGRPLRSRGSSQSGKRNERLAMSSTSLLIPCAEKK